MRSVLVTGVSSGIGKAIAEELLNNDFFVIGSVRKKEDAKYFEMCIKVGKQTSIEAADNALTAFKNWNGVDTLKNIKNETLIVWGDQDKSYNIKEIEILKKNILNSSLVVFKECAHNVHLEKVEEFNNKIQEFLNR